MKCQSITIFIVLCLINCIYAANKSVTQHLTYPLPKFNIIPNSLSISGLSSGAYMAVQFQIAFSKSIKGVGVFAGGPYYCSVSDFATANAACMKVPSMINLNNIKQKILTFESSNLIDPIVNVKKHLIYLFSGTKDYIVFPDVMKKLNQQYIESFNVNDKQIVSDFNVPASHAMVTNNYGNKCDYFGSPYINNCNLDGALKTLQTIYPTFKPNSISPNPDSFFTFSQSNSYNATSFDDVGFIYIPKDCQQGRECMVHVVIHGCTQGKSFIGDVYAQHAGYLEYAEANQLILLFPQVKAYGGINVNPNGCWDWWGYTGKDFYATNKGPQMAAIKNMLADLGVDI
ncbi:hypothetical protein ABK040_015519 [Willaertia magna]